MSLRVPFSQGISLIGKAPPLVPKDPEKRNAETRVWFRRCGIDNTD
jgi:hypothetical protein